MVLLKRSHSGTRGQKRKAEADAFFFAEGDQLDAEGQHFRAKLFKHRQPHQNAQRAVEGTGVRHSIQVREEHKRRCVGFRGSAQAAQAARVVDTLSSRCGAVWALGDSNFHGLRLPGLTSAWDDVPGTVGTLGSYRRIDDVFGPGPPHRVEMFVTESDHRMVLAEYG